MGVILKVIFAAGGTGGHINPALAVAAELRRREKDCKILFIGTCDKMESRLVPAAGFDFASIEISGFHRKLNPSNIVKNMQTLLKLIKSSSQSRAIIEDFNPDVVIGFGGYVSGPVVRAAAKMGIKTAIHEQNAFPGMANKALAKRADVVMLATKKAAEHLECRNEPIVTGLPIRSEVTEIQRDFARAELGLDERPLILSTGGSLGARVFNESIVNLIVALQESKKCNFIHAYGQSGSWVKESLAEKGVKLDREKHIDVKEYIYDMPRCLAAADIIINRAGASTISEIEAAGLASILIPSPNVTENHQYHNAMDLVRNDAAIVIEEKDLTTESLLEAVNSLLDDVEKRKRMGANAKKMFVANAQGKIADVLTKLAKKQ